MMVHHDIIKRTMTQEPWLQKLNFHVKPLRLSVDETTLRVAVSRQLLTLLCHQSERKLCDMCRVHGDDAETIEAGGN
jgi:hypothetical protein